MQQLFLKHQNKLKNRMAYIVGKTPVSDLSERKAIGIKMPFSCRSVFQPTYRTVDAYKTNILNYLSTAKGDRYFNPMFGTSILNSLFEHYTPERKKSIEQELKFELNYYFPKVVIDELELTSTEELNSFQLHIEFSIQDTNQKESLTLNFG